MDKNMTLAVVAAAAIHGGVLFGWPEGAAPLRTATPERLCALDIVPLPPEKDELIVPPPDEIEKPQRGMPRPTGDEPPTIVKLTDITIPRPPHVPIDPGIAKEIPVGPPGVIDGADINRPPVFSPGMLDKSPRTVSQIAPQYPFDKKREGIAGEVHVEFTVDESGRVIEPRVVHSTDRAFDAPTLAAVSKWRFEPGRRDGRVVRFRMVVPVVFSLND